MASHSNRRHDDGSRSDRGRYNLTRYKRYRRLKDGGFRLPTAVHFRIQFGLDLLDPGAAVFIRLGGGAEILQQAIDILRAARTQALGCLAQDLVLSGIGLRRRSMVCILLFIGLGPVAVVALLWRDPRRWRPQRHRQE